VHLKDARGRNSDRERRSNVMPHTKRQQSIRTTIGELTAAYYEAALAELKDATLAARVAERMVKDALTKGHLDFVR
jgi:hypothetical protein